jgi:hypothetical protein
MRRAYYKVITTMSPFFGELPTPREHDEVGPITSAYTVACEDDVLAHGVDGDAKLVCDLLIR